MYRAKHAKQRQHITAVILCFTMLFSIISGVLPLQYASAEEFYTATETVESFSGYSVHDGFVEITQYDKVEVYADSADAYQWQILINNVIWVNIQDQNEQTIQVGYALVASALDENDMAFIRCAYGDGLYSDELAVLSPCPA